MAPPKPTKKRFSAATPLDSTGSKRNMDLQLKDKVVLITGGAKGIGAAIARGCAREGAFPVVVDKDGKAGKQLQMELQKSGRSSTGIYADLFPAPNLPPPLTQT